MNRYHERTVNWWVAVNDPELGYLHIDEFELGDCEACQGEGGWRKGGHPGAIPESVDCPDCEATGTWAYNYRDEDPFPVEPARCSICSHEIEPDASYPLCALHEGSSREAGKALADEQRYARETA